MKILATLLSPLFLLAGTAACSTSSSPTNDALPIASVPTKIEGLKYGDGPRNTFDLYLPQNAKRPPIVIYVHGGRWFRNDSTQIELYDRVSQLTEAGFAIASINFTYSKDAVWPAQLDDTIAAIEHIRSAASTHGYDADRIALWGQSSGAHMAMMATIELAERGNSPIDALVHWYGPSDLFHIRQDRIDDDVPGENERFTEPSPETILLGAPISQSQEKAAQASPVQRIQALSTAVKLPPILLAHGDSDFVISPLQTQRIQRALLERDPNALVELRMVRGARHGGDGFESETAPAIKFLESYAAN